MVGALFLSAPHNPLPASRLYGLARSEAVLVGALEPLVALESSVSAAADCGAYAGGKQRPQGTGQASSRLSYVAARTTVRAAATRSWLAVAATDADPTVRALAANAIARATAGRSGDARRR